MGWLLELLFGAIREMCSQFIVDMMDIASGMFTEILSCDLDLFEELFGVAGDLYNNAVLPISIALLLMILSWQLFKSMFGKMGTASEDPIELVFRSGFCLFMIVFAKDIVNYIMEIAGTPYQWITGTEITVESFSEYVSVSEAVTSSLGVDAISIQLLLLIMQFVVAWNYFKLLFLLAERYVLLGIFSYTSPLAFATGGSKATNNILGSWTKMFGGQVMLIILDAWCMKMFLSGYGNLMASSYGFTKFFAATMCLIGFCKITGKLDSYMGSLGVNLGRSGGGLSGLGALMMAGRLLHGGGKMAAGALGNAAAGHMNFGIGKTIPLGKGAQESSSGSTSGASGAWTAQGNGIGGMKAGMDGMGMAQEPEKGNGKSLWQEGGYDAFEATGQEFDNSYLPFGDPEGGEPEMPDGTKDMDSLDAADSLASGGDLEEQTDTFPGMDENMAPGIPEPIGEAGRMQDEEEIIPYEDMAGGSSFGMPMGAEEPQISEIGNAEEPMLSSGEMQSDGAYTDSAAEAGANYGTDSIADMDDFGGTGGSDLTAVDIGESEGSISAGDYGNETVFSYEEAGTYGGVGSYGEAGAHGESESYETGTSYGKSEGTGVESGYFAGGEQASGHLSGKEFSGVSGGYDDVGTGGLTESTGTYTSMHDGRPYMRYDAEVYAKPSGEYQTIHENGKTFYELPEGGMAPSILPQTSAVLEKGGNIRIEQNSWKETEKQNGYRRPMVHIEPAASKGQQQIPAKTGGTDAGKKAQEFPARKKHRKNPNADRKNNGNKKR